MSKFLTRGRPAFSLPWPTPLKRLGCMSTAFRGRVTLEIWPPVSLLPDELVAHPPALYLHAAEDFPCPLRVLGVQIG